MAGERPGGPKVVDMPDTPGRPTLPGKPGAPGGGGGGGGKPGAPGDGRELPGPTPTPPGDGRDPIVKPPEPNPPGTDPGRPVLPGQDPLPPINIGGRTPPTKTNPGEDENFNKGQVRDQLLPGSPTDPGGLGQFNPYNTGFGPRGGRAPGGQGGGPGSSGAGRNRPSTYDPLGIGQDNYGLSRPIGNRTAEDGSSENAYSMTGVNAATGYKGPARFGVVGGQGGYGSGMVAPEYTGPQFDSAKDVMKAYRQQRRRGDRSGIAVPVAQPPFSGGGATGGGGTVDGPGGFGPAGGKPGAPQGAAGGGAGEAGGYGGKPGAPAAAGGAAGADPNAQQASSGKPGAPPAAAGANGAQPEAGAAPSAAEGFGSKAPGWDPTTTPTSMGNIFDTQWGRLVPSSTGNQNVMQLENDPTKLFHYDPNAADGAGAKGGWKSMTPESYRSYGDYNYVDPRTAGAAASPMMQSWEKKGGLMQGKVGTGAYA